MPMQRLDYLVMNERSFLKKTFPFSWHGMILFIFTFPDSQRLLSFHKCKCTIGSEDFILLPRGKPQMIRVNYKGRCSDCGDCCLQQREIRDFRRLAVRCGVLTEKLSAESTIRTANGFSYIAGRQITQPWIGLSNNKHMQYVVTKPSHYRAILIYIHRHPGLHIYKEPNVFR